MANESVAPPPSFWRLLLLYVVSGAVAIPGAVLFVFTEKSPVDALGYSILAASVALSLTVWYFLNLYFTHRVELSGLTEKNRKAEGQAKAGDLPRATV
jgi:hypothetical protein